MTTKDIVMIAGSTSFVIFILGGLLTWMIYSNKQRQDKLKSLEKKVDSLLTPVNPVYMRRYGHNAVQALNDAQATLMDIADEVNAIDARVKQVQGQFAAFYQANKNTKEEADHPRSFPKI